METLTIRKTSIDIMKAVDSCEYLSWSFIEREEGIGILKNAQNILRSITSDLSDTEWQERSEYQANIIKLDKYIAALTTAKFAFDGRIEPKAIKVEDTVMVENDSVEVRKIWVAMLLWCIGIIGSLVLACFIF
ncbi:MAG: hypothetical protein MUF12_00990 [Sediminibacterium sp.]|jgi:hypothetical protein|nr:hypothetical protein [Sediminibacterium sp.]